MEDTTMSQSERRNRPRFPTAVELKLHAPELHFVLLSRTIDMSTQGAFVRSNRPLPVGLNVMVQFERGRDRNPLTVRAQVVRVATPDEGRTSGIAVQFQEISELDEAIISDLIEAAKA